MSAPSSRQSVDHTLPESNDPSVLQVFFAQGCMINLTATELCQEQIAALKEDGHLMSARILMFEKQRDSDKTLIDLQEQQIKEFEQKARDDRRDMKATKDSLKKVRGSKFLQRNLPLTTCVSGFVQDE
jgi:hypothetical protein